MPLTASIERRRSGYSRLFQKPPQIGKKWDGKFRLQQAFSRVKKRTKQPADDYTAYDDKRAMQASVEAHVNVLIDAMTIKAAYGYLGDTLDSDDGENKFLRYAVGYKETLIGQAELIAWSNLLERSKFIHSRYHADTLGREAVRYFNDKELLGPCVVAAFEANDVVLKFDNRKKQ